MPTEAETCRKVVVPELPAAGWDKAPPCIAAQVGSPDAAPFDLLCHLAFDTLVLTHRQHTESWAGFAMANMREVGIFVRRK